MEISFDEFIDQQIARKQPDPLVDPDETLRQWTQDLERFNHAVRDFLQEYIAAGKVSLTTAKKQMNEQIIGNYEAESLVLEIGANKVCFDPIGRYVIGARGRVDMNGPHGTVKFLLVPKDAASPLFGVRRVSITEKPPPDSEPMEHISEWTWKIGTPPPNSQYLDLHKESFHKAVMEIVNG